MIMRIKRIMIKMIMTIQQETHRSKLLRVHNTFRITIIIIMMTMVIIMMSGKDYKDYVDYDYEDYDVMYAQHL